jgi:transposase-like protein
MARFKRCEDPNKAVEFWLTQAGLALISGWRQGGMSEKQIAKEMGITHKTLYNWSKQYDEVFKALQFGVQEVQYQIENALERAAIGGSTKETKVTTLIKSGQVVETLKEEFIREVQPDVRAIKLYLGNRDPSKWQQDKLSLLAEDGEDSHIQVVVHKHVTEDQEAQQAEPQDEG